MESNSLSKINIAARQIRAWAEQNYHRYEARPSMCGMCAVASLQLFKALQKKGIHTKIAEAYGHVFLLYDNHIIDITATQFGNYPKVLIRKVKTREDTEWEPLYVWQSDKDFLKNTPEFWFPGQPGW